MTNTKDLKRPNETLPHVNAHCKGVNESFSPSNTHCKGALKQGDLKDMTLSEVEMLLVENYEACANNCGVNDKYNTIPAWQAYTDFTALLKYIKHLVELHKEAEQLFTDKAV